MVDRDGAQVEGFFVAGSKYTRSAHADDGRCKEDSGQAAKKGAYTEKNSRRGLLSVRRYKAIRMRTSRAAIAHAGGCC